MNFENFMELLCEILIQDQSQGSEYFTCHADFSEATLKLSVLLKIDLSLRSVEKSASEAVVQIESLLRVAQICERSIKFANFKGGMDRLEETDQNMEALVSAGIILHAYCYFNQQSLRVSEDGIESAIDLVKRVGQAMVAHKDDQTSIDRQDCVISPMGNRLCTHQIFLLELIGKYIQTAPITEYLLTTIEFCCFKLLSQQHQVGTPTDTALVRRHCVTIIVGIYEKYSDQRHFLVKELCALFPLGLTELTVRNYITPCGKIAPLHAAFLEFVKLSGTTFDEDLNHLRHEWMIICSKPDAELDMMRFLAEKTNLLMQKLEGCMTQASDMAKEIVINMSQSYLDRPKTGFQDSVKHPLISFLEDISSCLDYRDYSSSVVLLHCGCLYMFKLLETKLDNSILRTSILECLGLLATRMKQMEVDSPSRLGKGASSAKHILNNLEINTTGADCMENGHVLDFFESLQANGVLFSVPTCSSTIFNVIHFTCQLLRQFQNSPSKHSKTFIDKLLARALPLIGTRHDTYTLVDLEQKVTEANLAYQFMQIQSPLFQLYNPILVVLLKQMDANVIALKTKALRVFSNLSSVDEKVVLQAEVATAISNCVFDKSVQVRDAAVEIICKHSLKESQVAKHFLKLLKSRSSV